MFRKTFCGKGMVLFVFAGLLQSVLLASIAAGDINAKIAQLDINTATRNDVIKIFGRPEKYLWSGKTFTEDNLPSTYIAAYPNGFRVVMSRGKISELRFERPGAGYVYQGKLRVGSSLDEVLKVVGQPTEIVEGQPSRLADGILYKDIDGRKGHCYYARSDRGIRMFFSDYKIAALYVTGAGFSGDGNGADRNGPKTVKQSGPVKSFPKIDRKPQASGWGRGKLRSIPKYNPNSTQPFQVDLRGADLSRLDLKGSLQRLLYADFDSRTVWPTGNGMPPKFDREQIMELGKNPGLGVRDLHKKGITGRGVGIAILDQPLLVDHIEYKDRLRLYEEINIEKGRPAQMHGPAVASIAVGKTLGVAPEADLYYIGQWNADFEKGKSVWNFTYLAEGVHRILEINEQLAKDKKIRVISISVGWSPSQKGYKEITKAVQKAKRSGMLVICSSTEQVHGFAFHGLGRPPSANPDYFSSYEPGAWWAKHFYEGNQFHRRSNRLLVPMDSRTTASPAGTGEYVFYRHGGWSWAIPYIAGAYALAAQVNSNITPDGFWALAMKTGRSIELDNGKKIPFGPILDPVRLIGAVKTGE